MPFKKMTIREQRSAKRELKRLHQLERALVSDYSGTRIAEGVICSAAGGAIRAARTLGYVVIVRGHPNKDGEFIAAAYRIGGTA